MTNFRTTLTLPVQKKGISYADHILLLGSCFAENIGSKLAYYKLPFLGNPFGILYNPESLAQSLELLCQPKAFQQKDLFEQDGVWNSFHHHSRFSGTDPEAVLAGINEHIQVGADFLKKTDYLLLTFGTAWVYAYLNTGQIVSNCHKVPAREFRRFRLSVEDIQKRWSKLISKLQEINPKLQIIFTVSPVRHLKDGFHENQLSKSTLHLAIDSLQKEFTHAHYFPSYELLLDDLRDYRFYETDMLHPSAQAIDYIWEQFAATWIDPKSRKLFQSIEKIKKAAQHRPFQPNTTAHQKFIQKNIESIQCLIAQNPTIDFSEELGVFKEQLQHLPSAKADGK